MVEASSWKQNRLANIVYRKRKNKGEGVHFGTDNTHILSPIFFSFVFQEIAHKVYEVDSQPLTYENLIHHSFVANNNLLRLVLLVDVADSHILFLLSINR